jgi:hypothetical protein
MSQRALIGCAVTVLLAFLSWLTILPGTPKMYAPFNLLVFVPVGLTEGVLGRASKLVGIAVVPFLFCVWCLPVLGGCQEVPVRSIILLVCAGALSALLLICGFGSGLTYHDVGYVVGVTIMSIICWTIVGVSALVAWRCPSAGRNLAFHVALFAWLAWYAFPYLGEVP